MKHSPAHLFLLVFLLSFSTFSKANDLSISISSAPDPVYENGIITYALTIKNNGSGLATNITIVDTLNTGLSFIALDSDSMCTEASNEVTCTIDDIGSGMEKTINVVASTLTAQEISNTAIVSASETDPDTSNNSVTHVTEIKSTGEFLVGAIAGGSVNRFSYDPNNNNTIYTSTIGAGVFKSTDDGNSWSPIFLPTQRGHFIRDVLPSKETPNLVFVCAAAPSGAAIWRSADGGLNFTNELGISAGACHHIIDGNDASTYYAAVNDVDVLTGNNAIGKIYKSTNNGLTWTKLSGVINGLFITNIVQLPSDRLVIGTHDGGIGGFTGHMNQGDVYYSDDEGVSWIEVTSIDFTNAIVGLESNGADNIINVNIQATTGDGSNAKVYSSSDGINWVLSVEYTSAGIGKNAAVYHQATDTYFLLYDKLIKSGTGPGYVWPVSPTDLKATFPSYLSAPSTLAIDPDSSATLLLGLDGGDAVVRSDDGGANWLISNDGYNAQRIEVATKDKDSGYRYAGNRKGFVYFSEAQLSQWKNIYRSETDIGHITTIVYDHNFPQRVFLPFFNGTIIVNNDVITNGEDVDPFAHIHWGNVTYPSLGTGAAPYDMWVNGNTMFLGIALPDNTSAGNYLLKSTDNGANWNTVNTLTTVGGVRTLVVHPLDNNVMYAGSGDYDSGQNSTHPNPANGNGLFKSTDGGDTWVQLNSNNTINSSIPKRILIDPKDKDTKRVWLHTVSSTPDDFGKVWESLDGGESWHEITPFDVGFANSIAYISSDDVLLSTSGSRNKNINVTQLKPGTCTASCQWSDAFGVYGTVEVLYNGSAGVGTGSGLFEFANVPAPPSSTGRSSGGSLSPVFITIFFGFFLLASLASYKRI